MKILYITPAYFPAFKFGGPIQSDYQLGIALSRKGVEVDVLTTNCGLENRKDIKLSQWMNIDGIRVKYFSYLMGEYYTFSPGLFLDALKKVRKYDLVHISAFWNFQALAGSLASVINKKPYLISPRGVLYEEAINIETTYLKKLYFSLFAKQYLSYAAGVHFTTEDERDNMADFIKPCIRGERFVIPNGIDLNNYKELPRKGLFKAKYPILRDKKNILFLSRVHKKKGLDILIGTFKELIKQNEQLFLVIVGPDNDSYTSQLKKLICSYDLDQKVLFTGMLTGEDKLSAYVDAEAFILPSYFENFGMAPVEAMACGTPIVISDKVGIYKEVEKHKAGVVVKNDPNSLFQSINRLLGDSNLQKQISANGKNLVSTYYNIDNVADQMIGAYNKLLLKVKK